jgi:uncharacterized SAM-binding protein YcdF (DUF218 family)
VHLVAVLGYSGRRGDALHDVCAKRLRQAEELVDDADAVLLSGWGRRRNGAGEAELMRAAWNGGDVPLLVDDKPRSTVENAVGVATTARRLDATEVTVVTSRWHAFRAGALVRAALPGVAVRTSSPPGGPPVLLLAREAVCLLAFPYHLLRLRLQEQFHSGQTTRS